jgi:hypothetical protein
MADDVIQLGPPDDDRGDREDQLPEHERDDDTVAGAGLMGSGGTAVDRGTGELGGTAQGPALGGDEDDSVAGADAGMVAGTPAGGAQPYVQAFVDDDEDEALPDA